jgi:hypothetical protein
MRTQLAAMVAACRTFVKRQQAAAGAARAEPYCSSPLAQVLGTVAMGSTRLSTWQHAQGSPLAQSSQSAAIRNHPEVFTAARQQKLDQLLQRVWQLQPRIQQQVQNIGHVLQHMGGWQWAVGILCASGALSELKAQGHQAWLEVFQPLRTLHITYICEWHAGWQHQAQAVGGF